MESAGARLKKIRLEKGISLEEAQKKTKLHINIIMGIEEDGIVNVSPAYLKGFLKIYCDFLGQDPKDFVSGSDSLKQAHETKSEIKDRIIKYPKIPPVKLSPPKPFFKSKIFFIGLSIFALFLLLKFLGRRHTQAPISKPQPVKEVKVAIPKKNLPPVALPRVRLSEKSAQKQTGQPLRLAIYIKDDCWVGVKIDGKTVLGSVLKKGKSETWQAKEKIELTLGNAGLVELEIDAKRIAPLGRKGQTVKNILITKKGLVVGR